ncbi:MAG: hypothetical protein KDA75_08315, partial [Planctomycetaceae bacterium]|nr:hypothetical protein [Planctomycetaceae bacterium]
MTVSQCLRRWSRRVLQPVVVFRRPPTCDAPVPRSVGCAPRLTFERLEDRLLLATFTVTSLSNGGAGSLRVAIVEANANAGHDTIDFQGTASEGTILLLSEIDVTDDLTILGNGRHRTVIDAQQNSRIFDVSGAGTDLTLEGLTLRNGQTDTASQPGGAIRSTATGTAAIAISDSLVEGNSTTQSGSAGGAVFAQAASILISRSTFRDNFTLGTSGGNSRGGAIAGGSGAITITNSTFNGNFTQGTGSHGGAISGGQMLIVNSTVSGNSVQGSGVDGGGISSTGNAATIVNSTITLNTAADSGGGIQSPSVNFGESLTIINSIVAGNTATTNPDFSAPGGTPGSLVVRNSLIGDNEGTTLPEAQTADANGNFVGQTIANLGTGRVDPLLAALAFNGGPTQTHALRPGSLALNSGNGARATSNGQPGGTALTADQRGLPFARIAGSSVDMGAFEAAPMPVGSLIVSTAVDESDGVFMSGDLSLREAIELANANVGVADTITFAAALNAAPLQLTLGQFQVADDLTIIGNGPLATIVDAQQRSRIFDVTGPGTDLGVTGLQLRNGRVTATSEQGGAIRSLATGASQISIVDSTLRDNTTTGLSGGGGAVYVLSAALVITDSTIEENSTSGNGGAGGAIYGVDGLIQIQDSILNGNFTSNSNAPGGAVFSSNGPVLVERTVLHDNMTTGSNSRGGAIATTNAAASVTVIDSTINSNGTMGSSAAGGAISTQSAGVSVLRSSIHDNATTGNNSDGGALASVDGAIVVDLSTLSGNTTGGSSADGGAIASLASAGVTIRNSTLSGNRVDGTGVRGGGAIYVNNSDVLIVNSTITNNSAHTGGGIGVANLYAGESLTIINSIVAGNTATTSPDFTAPAGTPGTLVVRHSLIGRSDGTTLAPTSGSTPDGNGNFIGGATSGTAINPQLGPLTHNGGPTRVHALLPGSLAIDSADKTLATDTGLPGGMKLTSDQRLAPFSRLAGVDVDMGAYERQSFAAAAFIVDEAADEFLPGSTGPFDRSLREVINLANGSVGPDVITFSPALAGTPLLIELGALLVTEDLTIVGHAGLTTVLDAQQQSRLFDVIGTGTDFTISFLTLQNGRTTDDSDSGGAIRSLASGLSTITINDSVLSGNSTLGQGAQGGAVFSDLSRVVVNRSTVSGNSTAGNFAAGGAIRSGYEVVVTATTFSGNMTTGSNSDGGAILAGGNSARIVNSTFSGNSAGGSNSNGGAMRFSFIDVTVVQSTIAGNSASGFGGGIAFDPFDTGESLTLHNSILAGNTASSAPDFTPPDDPGMNLIVVNSLIGRSDTTGLSPTSGATPDANGNFVGGTTAGTAINPQLGLLQDNGGPTFTRALLAGSLAINSGSNDLAVNAGLTNDQRGAPFFRIFGSTVDMGAAEHQSLLIQGNTAFLTGTPNRDSIVYRVANKQVNVNGVNYVLPSNITLVQIDGLGDKDTLNLIGTLNAESAVTGSGMLQFEHDATHTGFDITGMNLEVIILDGQGGSD